MDNVTIRDGSRGTTLGQQGHLHHFDPANEVQVDLGHTVEIQGTKSDNLSSTLLAEHVR